ncbi:MAG: DUF3822 family protein [Saprospiraceae bacterium]|nr:DUF3822 family protein [Saprospiraceae bacterium]
MKDIATDTLNELSILLRMDSFAFMIIDQSNIVSVFERIPFKTPQRNFRYIDPVELLSIVQNNNLRYTRFEKVHISIDHSLFTYVPAELYDQDGWFDYLNFVAAGVTKDDVVNSAMPAEKVCIYTYPLGVRKLMSTLYPTTQVQHLSESLAVFLGREVSDDPTLFYLVHGDAGYIFVFENKELTLVNRYHAPSVKDRLYYILLTCKHRRLNPRKAYIKITGTRDAVDGLQTELEKYFIHIQQINWKNGWRLPLSVKNPMELFEFYCIHHANNWRNV